MATHGFLFIGIESSVLFVGLLYIYFIVNKEKNRTESASLRVDTRETQQGRSVFTQADTGTVPLASLGRLPKHRAERGWAECYDVVLNNKWSKCWNRSHSPYLQAFFAIISLAMQASSKVSSALRHFAAE